MGYQVALMVKVLMDGMEWEEGLRYFFFLLWSSGKVSFEIDNIWQRKKKIVRHCFVLSSDHSCVFF